MWQECVWTYISTNFFFFFKGKCFMGGLRLYLPSSTCSVQSCTILLSMLFSFTLGFCSILAPSTWASIANLCHTIHVWHLLEEFCGTTAGDAHMHRCGDFNQVIIYLLSCHHCSGEENIHDQPSSFSMFSCSCLDRPLGLSWQWGGQIAGELNGIRSHLCHQRPPLISLRLPNKGIASFLLATHIFVSPKKCQKATKRAVAVAH